MRRKRNSLDYAQLEPKQLLATIVTSDTLIGSENFKQFETISVKTNELLGYISLPISTPWPSANSEWQIYDPALDKANSEFQ